MVCNIVLIILGRVSSCSPKYWEIFSQINSWLISGFIDVPSTTESKKENIDCWTENNDSPFSFAS